MAQLDPTPDGDAPQIYVYLNSGGILEWTVTRGDIEVVAVDWDENMERSIEDWEDVIAELENLPPGKLRRQEIASAQEEIDKLRFYEEADRIANEQAEAKRVEAARELLKSRGEI